MFGLGITELIAILVVALLIFGPGKLPEIGSALGRSIRDFRKALEHRGEAGSELPGAPASEKRSDIPGA